MKQVIRELPSNKEIIKSTLPNFLVIFVLLFLSAVWHAKFWIIIGVLYAITIANILWASQDKKYDSWLALLKEVVVGLGSLTVLIIVYRLLAWLLGGHGVWSLIIMSLAVGLIILFRRRKLYMMAVRDIERQIWGFTAEERRDARRGRSWKK